MTESKVVEGILHHHLENLEDWQSLGVERAISDHVSYLSGLKLPNGEAQYPHLQDDKGVEEYVRMAYLMLRLWQSGRIPVLPDGVGNEPKDGICQICANLVDQKCILPDRVLVPG